MQLALIVKRKAEILAELRLRKEKNSLSSFLRAAWPIIEPKHPFIPGWHIDAIAEHLEAVKAGEIRNLLINIPPRHVKSTLVSVAFPAWMWTERPEHKFIYASYSHSLAKRDSVKTRNIIQSNWYRERFKINWNLADDQNEKTNYLNTIGGFRRATTILGGIIGEGADTLVFDDPQSPRTVRSELKREDLLDWIDQEFFTRINDPKTVSKIGIMQRLDQKDVSAHVLAKGDFVHLMLPAEFEPERKCFTCIGFEDPRKEAGEPLWPARFGKAELIAMAKDMTPKAWAGQGQQRPAPADGIIFKRSGLSNFYTEDPRQLVEKMDFVALSIDLPFDEAGTFAVFQVWGRMVTKKYLLDQIRGQVGFKEQVAMFRTIKSKWPEIMASWVEKKANGAAIISTLKGEFSGLIPINPQGSKEVRAEAVSPEFDAGDVILPDPSIAPWIGDYIEEFIVFNNGLFNDQVDATTQALMKLKKVSPTGVVPVSITGPSKWLGRA